jgi:IS1 family transposase
MQYRFTRTKRKLIGRTWVWTAIDVPTRLLICFHIGNRELEDARIHLKNLCSRLNNKPLFTSDELIHYKTILKEIYSSKVYLPRTGKRGRPKNPITVVDDDDLDYVTVKKSRVNGHVGSITRKIIFGSSESIAKRLKISSSKTINTSYVERSNGLIRLWDAHFTRKSLNFAKSLDLLHAKLAILAISYNFIRPHGTLSKSSSGINTPTTPAMAAGISSHPWSYNELLSGYPSC